MNQTIDEEYIKNYCLHHQLKRPHINISKVLCIVSMVIAMIGMFSYFLCLLFDFSFFICFEVLVIAVVFCFAGAILQFLVRCYQCYASENTRRQCSCMPSCSEYALLSLEKYVWPKALWKIWRRVTHTCSLPGYHIDYP